MIEKSNLKKKQSGSEKQNYLHIFGMTPPHPPLYKPFAFGKLQNERPVFRSHFEERSVLLRLHK